MELKSSRLYIRPIKLDDKQAVFNYRSDSETNKYQSWIPNNLDDVEEFIGKTAQELNIPHTWFQLVIIEHESGLIIGDIGLHFIDDENKQVEIGCTIIKTHQGNGYATEALKSTITYLFTELCKHRIITSIDPLNIHSIRLVEKLGFRKEAHFIESLFINGQWVDDIIYAMLNRDWKLNA